jgi:transposase
MDGRPLEQLAADRKRLRGELERTTAELRAAVLAALAAGVSESAAARRAGVGRMTVRGWAGKSPWGAG